MKIVVFNNGALGFVELEQKSSGFLYSGTDLVNPNFAALAEAVGIKGVRIANPAEVEPKLHEAFAHPGPVLVDAVVNRMELAMSPRVTAEMAKGFTLYLLKAVMSGRGPTKSSNWPEPTCGVERLRSRFTVTVDYLSPGEMRATELSMMQLDQIVNRDPDILSGTPVFLGTRVPIRSLFDFLEGGDTLDEFLRQFPSVRREQAIGLLDWARESVTADARAA